MPWREKNRKTKKKGEISTATASIAFFFYIDVRVCVCSEHTNARSLDKRKRGTAKNEDSIKGEEEKEELDEVESSRTHV